MCLRVIRDGKSLEVSRQNLIYCPDAATSRVPTFLKTSAGLLLLSLWASGVYSMQMTFQVYDNFIGKVNRITGTWVVKRRKAVLSPLFSCQEAQLLIRHPFEDVLNIKQTRQRTNTQNIMCCSAEVDLGKRHHPLLIAMIETLPLIKEMEN